MVFLERAPVGSSRAAAQGLHPVRRSAALRWDSSAGRALVVADLHIGLGDPRGRGTGLAERSAGAMAQELLSLAHRERARRVVVAGDVKHPIVGAPGRVGALLFEFCSELLASGLELEVVTGNHDVGLARHLPREVLVHGAGGLLRDGVGVFHGHRWPEAELDRARTLVAGHLHPGFRLASGTGGGPEKLRCWLRVEYPDRQRPRRPGGKPMQARELLILPAFNPLGGIETLNRNAPRRGRSFLFHRFLAGTHPRAFLLDGLEVGTIPTPPRPAAARRRARRARAPARGTGSRSRRAPSAP
jgi:uncharacterized protein